MPPDDFVTSAASPLPSIEKRYPYLLDEICSIPQLVCGFFRCHS